MVPVEVTIVVPEDIVEVDLGPRIVVTGGATSGRVNTTSRVNRPRFE